LLEDLARGVEEAQVEAEVGAIGADEEVWIHV
jgi:hypothetical protein